MERECVCYEEGERGKERERDSEREREWEVMFKVYNILSLLNNFRLLLVKILPIVSCLSILATLILGCGKSVLHFIYHYYVHVYFLSCLCRGIYLVADKMTIDDFFFNLQNEWYMLCLYTSKSLSPSLSNTHTHTPTGCVFATAWQRLKLKEQKMSLRLASSCIWMVRPNISQHFNVNSGGISSLSFLTICTCLCMHMHEPLEWVGRVSIGQWSFL